MKKPIILENHPQAKVKLRVLDLCCGFGGFSSGFFARGHHVTGLDIEEPAEIVMDVRNYKGVEGSFDVVLAGPPCTEFSKDSMPWYDHTKPPSLDLVHACLRIISEIKPRFWLLENVRGATPYIDKLAQQHSKVGPHYFWGDFPLFYRREVYKRKSRINGLARGKRLRSRIPFAVSHEMSIAVEAEYEKADPVLSPNPSLWYRPGSESDGGERREECPDEGSEG